MSDAPHPETLDRGRYRIDRVLGVGGTATVYLAHDTRMSVPRAIKVLAADFARSKQSRARFLNEAHAQAGLKHQNVLMVHDVIDDDQGLYLVMELAESDSIGARVARHGVLSPRQTAEVGLAVGGALIVAHAAGVVHRDIKPANILVDRHGVLKLADFGIARVLDRKEELTRTGTVMGTWAYMPPEQRQADRQLDGRADVYALGVTLHALLTGRHSPNLHNQEAWAEAFAGVPESLAQIIQRATRLYPEDRYPDIGAMVAALREVESTLAGPTLAEAPVVGAADALALSGVDPDAPDAPNTTDVVAPDGPPPRATAVPIADTHHTWIPATAPPSQRPPPSAEAAPDKPVWPLLAAAAGAFLVVSIGGALVLPHLLDTADPAPVSVAPSPQPVPSPAADPTTGPTADPTTGPTADPTGAAHGATASGQTSGQASGQAPSEPPAADPIPDPQAAAPAPAPAPAPRRIITVVPGATADPAAATPEGTQPGAPDLGPTGAVAVRTVPSGASISVGGRALQTDSNGTYSLPVGGHVLEITSATGERHRVPVQIQAEKRVDICYSFDTNSACGAAP